MVGKGTMGPNLATSMCDDSDDMQLLLKPQIVFTFLLEYEFNQSDTVGPPSDKT